MLSFTKPHGPVSRDTVARWIKSMLHSADIDSTFTADSVRFASTSKVDKSGMPLEVVLDTANWSNATAFAKFYNRDIKLDDCATFQEAVVHVSPH